MARYDVFLCFRGRDTRHTFMGNLYAALRQARLRTFMDEGVLKGGDVADTIIQALEASRVSIVILSETFASSRWCLDELVNILDCMKTKNQTVIPIFYNVDPSDVRNLKGSFGAAMVAHEDGFGKDNERLQKWRSMKMGSERTMRDYKSGDSRFGYEYEYIERIVRSVTLVIPRYNIFVSFSGKDTRSFSGFLYNALSRRGYHTILNDGDQSSQSTTVGVIEKSKLSIIVFSENYARSPSCLDELLRILECKEMKNQLVCPIFYKVLPSDLRHQRNSYGEAMSEHENMMGKDSEKVKIWRSALFEVANLKGWYMKTGYSNNTILLLFLCLFS
uniref:Toll interleukin receptor n=1 Tax=Phaseolus vulgaris TaxID=3885 RepID=A3QVH0_PHAVU|nr:toll interleukin receptor [Phaseolus vulgaris]